MRTDLTVHVSAIIAAGGRGTRLGASMPKQFLMLGGRPILQHSVEAYLGHPLVMDIVVALPPDLLADLPAYLRDREKPVRVVEGGARRQDSVANAFAAVPPGASVVVIHDAARPLVPADVITRTITAAGESGAALAAMRATDTVKRGDGAGLVRETLPRDEVFLAQTPQAFRVDVLRAALAVQGEATDEAMLAERAGFPVRLVEGDPRNMKITAPGDLEAAERLAGAAGVAALRIGNGYDLHRLTPGRPLVLGGLTIPHDRGLQGHSDADAVCHAVTDAILGAAGAGDIGRHFPDTDPAWKDANSVELLRAAVAVVRRAGFEIVNVDVTVIAQAPKLAPHVDAMRARLGEVLGCGASRVSVKGKTNEGVDSMGAGESIAVHAVALLTQVGARA